MTDQNLLAFGCAVSFIVLAGAYVWIRAGFEREPREAEHGAVPEMREEETRHAIGDPVRGH